MFLFTVGGFSLGAPKERSSSSLRTRGGVRLTGSSCATVTTGVLRNYNKGRGVADVSGYVAELELRIGSVATMGSGIVGSTNITNIVGPKGASMRIVVKAGIRFITSTFSTLYGW